MALPTGKATEEQEKGSGESSSELDLLGVRQQPVEWLGGEAVKKTSADASFKEPCCKRGDRGTVFQ